MQKTSSFNLQDVILDPETVGGALTDACRNRQGNFRVTAVCQLDEIVTFVLQPTRDGAAGDEIVIVPVDEPTPEAFPRELFDRWTNGFNALGTIAAGGNSWLAVYARTRESGHAHAKPLPPA